MSDQKEIEKKEKENNNILHKKKKKQTDSSTKNLKKIRKGLMGLAEEEMLNIKKSKKDINVAYFEEKELIAPSKYSLTAKHLKIDSNKQQSNKLKEKVINPIKEEEDKKVENKENKENKEEISSSDISDDDEDNN